MLLSRSSPYLANDNTVPNSNTRLTPKPLPADNFNSNFNHWGGAQNQTFPKSNLKTRKPKRHSVQICQDPLHLDNVKDLRLNCPNKSSSSQLKKLSGIKLCPIAVLFVRISAINIVGLV